MLSIGKRKPLIHVIHHCIIKLQLLLECKAKCDCSHLRKWLRRGWWGNAKCNIKVRRICISSEDGECVGGTCPADTEPRALCASGSAPHPFNSWVNWKLKYTNIWASLELPAALAEAMPVWDWSCPICLTSRANTGSDYLFISDRHGDHDGGDSGNYFSEPSGEQLKITSN